MRASATTIGILARALESADRKQYLHGFRCRIEPVGRVTILDGIAATFAEQLRADAASALKAGERERAAALRMVLSELQKAAKDGHADELGVLRREHKRRLDAAAQFREADRPELAVSEESEAELIAGYLPGEISDEELARLVDDAVAQTGASSPRDMGVVMKAVMASAQGRADGGRVSARVKAVLQGAVRTGETG